MGYQRGIGEGVDLVNYTWVDTYLKGLKYQEKIKAIRDEIEDIRKFPRAKTEILEELNQIGEWVKALRVAKLGEVFSLFQSGEITAISPHILAQVHIVPNMAIVGRTHTAAHDFESLLAADLIQEALRDLPEGMTIAEKEAKIASLETKIKSLETKMADECWPDSRKVFGDKGQPRPGQDRWQEVVDHWRKMAAPYNKPVDLQGFALEQGEPAWEAFRKLGIPLRGMTTPRSRQRD
jgi:hypothetical protein